MRPKCFGIERAQRTLPPSSSQRSRTAPLAKPRSMASLVLMLDVSVSGLRDEKSGYAALRGDPRGKLYGPLVTQSFLAMSIKHSPNSNEGESMERRISRFRWR